MKRRSQEDLHDYQLKMIDWMLTNKKCALWAGVGLGKTVTTLTAIDTLLTKNEILLVLVGAIFVLEAVSVILQVGSFKLTGIPPMPAGLPRIAVTFLVDADGVLNVLAKEQRTGAEASVQVVPSFGLTREEVREIMHESIDMAQEDMAARESVDLRNKAKAMVAGTRKALEMSDLPPDQTFGIKRSANQLERLLQAESSVEEIQAATEDLSRLTAQVADDVISSAVKNSLSQRSE